ncbi:MAG: ferredoxin--NADP reductase [Oligoflexales bacterium]
MTGQSAPRRKKGWMPLTIEEIRQEAPDTLTYILIDKDEPTGIGFDYEPGQYLTFRFDNVLEKPLVRSYTMSSSPCQKGFVAFTVKKVDDGVISTWLMDSVKVGDVLRARGPIGKFCYFPNEHHKRLFMIGAGSGVTPFVSILREWDQILRLGKNKANLELLGVFRSQADIICAQELNDAGKNQDIKIHYALTRETSSGHSFYSGRPTPEMLDSAIGSYANTTFMICGPEGLMTTVISHLKHHGVEEKDILTESFFS